MLSQHLREYANQLADLPPSMYQRTPVWYVIALDAAGRPQGSLRDRATSQLSRGPEVLAPHRHRTVGVCPKLLVDTAEYVLGIGRPQSRAERVQTQHTRFVTLDGIFRVSHA